MKRLLVSSLCAAMITLVGCELAPPGSASSGVSTAQTPATQEQEQLLQEIRTIQQQTGQTVQTLLQDAQQRAARERSEQGMPGVVEDIMAAQDTIGDATEAAQLKNGPKAAAAIARLRGITLSILAERPASMVRRYCERALAYLKLSTPRLDEASAELTAAYDVTANGPDSAGVQPLLNQAKKQLSDGQAHSSSEVIATVISKTGKEKSVVLVNKMLAGLDGAQSALDRQAWPVVLAELLEVRRMLDDLGGQTHFRDEVAKVQPAPAAVAAPTDTTATTDETTSAAGTPATTPAAAPAATPTVAPTAAPAATPTVAPTAAPTAAPAVAPTAAPE